MTESKRKKQSRADSTPRIYSAILALLLGVVTIIVFWPVKNDLFLVYDDPQYVLSNPHVQNGLTLKDVAWAFKATYAANWHPLTWLSLMLDATLFGSGAAAPHLTNVLLHAANSILLFLLFLRMTGAIWRSAAVAMLFAIHPLHVESVAWISERKDVLCAFFGLLAMLCYTRYVERLGPRDSQAAARAQSPWTFYGLSLFFFACGLMSKPMVVTLPFVLLLLDLWPLQRFIASGVATASTLQRLLTEKLPFFALSLAESVATWRNCGAGASNCAI